MTRCRPAHVAALGVVLGCGVWSFEARGHHEAVFGPQSSLVLSAPGFLSVQGYSKNLGARGHDRQESTAVLSAGVTPWPAVPVSFALTMPASLASEAGSTRTGLENVVLGARYRFDFEALQRQWRKDGNFVMAVAAVEPPTGTMDHKALHGPFNYLGAMITSFERGPWGASFFVFFRREGTDSVGDKKGDELFFGGGVAFTPLDEPGRMVSFQLGMSEENHQRDRAAGRTQSGTGGFQWMVTPSIVGSPHPHLQLFALFSVPIAQDMADSSERVRWRAGFGLVYLLDPDKGGAPL